MKRSFHQLQELLPFLPAGAKGYILRYCVFSSLLALLDVAALALLALSIAGMLQGDAVRLPLLGTIQPSGYIWVVIAVALTPDFEKDTTNYIGVIPADTTKIFGFELIIEPQDVDKTERTLNGDPEGIYLYEDAPQHWRYPALDLGTNEFVLTLKNTWGPQHPPGSRISVFLSW